MYHWTDHSRGVVSSCAHWATEFVWQSCAFLCFPPLSSSSVLSPRRRASRLLPLLSEAPSHRTEAVSSGKREKDDLLLLLRRRRRVFFSGGARQSAGERARVLPLPPRKPFRLWFFLAHYSCRPAGWEEDFRIHLSLSRWARELRGVHLNLRCGAQANDVPLEKDSETVEVLGFHSQSD
jgi:hypothetical protein